MEAAGTAPASAELQRCCLRACRRSVSRSRRSPRRRHVTGEPTLEVSLHGRGSRRQVSPFMKPAIRATGRAGATPSPNYLSGEGELMRVRTYGFPGFFTRPTGVLDSQHRDEQPHVEAISPPVLHPLYGARGVPTHAAFPEGNECRRSPPDQSGALQDSSSAWVSTRSAPSAPAGAGEHRVQHGAGSG